MSMPIKTREDIRRDDEVEYLTKAVQILKEKTAAMQDIMEGLHQNSITIAYNNECDLRTAREVAQRMVQVTSNQSYNIGMMNAELDAVEHGLTQVKSGYF